MNDQKDISKLRIVISTEIKVISSVLSFSQDFHADLEPELYKQYDEKHFSYLIKWIIDQKQYTCFVAYIDEEPIGANIIEIRNYPETSITKARTVLFCFMIAVKPQYQKMGIAKSMIEKSFEFARENNISEFELEVSSKNFPALNLYHNMGFVHKRESLYKSI